MLDKFGFGKAQSSYVNPNVGQAGVRPILVDTSVIIDGRVADIAAAGFVRGELLVPRFVLAELQNIADSEDAMRRSRGRRGLEVLNMLRQTADTSVTVIEEDAPEIKEVDHKLVALAKRVGADLLTTDFNLNRVAQFEGVRVLNINELSNAIRPVVIPGEEMTVRIVQPGKERHQGVGYLPDGTMIVVENSDRLIGQDLNVEVTRVFQTVAGKMIFATIKDASSSPVVQLPTPPPVATPDSLSQPVGPVAQANRSPRQRRNQNNNQQPGGQPRPNQQRRRSPQQRLEDSIIAHVDAQTKRSHT